MSKHDQICPKTAQRGACDESFLEHCAEFCKSPLLCQLGRSWNFMIVQVPDTSRNANLRSQCNCLAPTRGIASNYDDEPWQCANSCQFWLHNIYVYDIVRLLFIYWLYSHCKWTDIQYYVSVCVCICMNTMSIYIYYICVCLCINCINDVCICAVKCPILTVWISEPVWWLARLGDVIGGGVYCERCLFKVEPKDGALIPVIYSSDLVSQYLHNLTYM